MVYILLRSPLLFVTLVLLCGWLIRQRGLRFSFARLLPHAIYPERDEQIDQARTVLVCLPGRAAEQAVERGISAGDRAFDPVSESEPGYVRGRARALALHALIWDESAQRGQPENTALLCSRIAVTPSESRLNWSL
jgi:hypothetical protein